MTETCRFRQGKGYEVCADEVRVERCGKSAPAAWQLVRHVNPIRCKIDEGYGWLARLRNRLSGLATGRVDR